MGGKNTTKQTTMSDTVSGPEPWMRTEGKNLYDTASANLPTTYQQYGGDRVADYGPDFQTALDAIKGNLGDNQDIDLARKNVGAVSAASQPQSVEELMNPYVGGVLSPTLQKLLEAHQNDIKSMEAQATGSGAFGDARTGVEAALGNRDYGQNVTNATNTAYSQAFQNAQNQQNTMLGRLLQAAGLSGQLGQMATGKATQLASILDQMAGQQKDVSQNKLNVNYQDFVNKNNFPLTRSSQLMQLLNQTPHNEQSSTTSQKNTSTPDNTLQQVLGKVASTALSSLFGGMGGGGLGSMLSGLFGGGAGSVQPWGMSAGADMSDADWGA